MARRKPRQKSVAPEPEPRSESEPEKENEEEEEEVVKLEREVKEMAKKIEKFRATLPDQLKSTLASLLSAQRPVLPDFDSGSDPASFSPGSGGHDQFGKSALATREDQMTSEKARLLREKILSNVSAMPIVLKRLKECTSRIDQLDSFNGTIHPAFKKKRTS